MGNFREYLPSGQFTGTVISLLVVAGLIGVAFVYPEEGTVSYSSPNSNVEVETLGNLINIAGNTDKDGDGLKDWEEILFKTDPDKKDTDGDGTSDGEEIGLGRNPALAGPKDKVPGTLASGEISSSESSFEELNATDKLARQFFAEYAQLKQSGGAVDALSEGKIIESIFSNPTLLKQARVYTEGELIVITDNSVSAIKRYGNDVGRTLKINPYKNPAENEIVILSRALESQSLAEIAKLGPIINSYEEIVFGLIRTNVPKELIPLHLGVVNSISGLLETIRNMRKLFEDPVSVLASLKIYEQSNRNVLSAFEQMKVFFKSKGISYGVSEDGVYLIGI